MIKPTLREEKKLWRQGYRYVAGVDEVGVAPFAGPVMACACVLNPKIDLRSLKFKRKILRDSKSLTKIQKEYFYHKLISHPKVSYALAAVGAKVIDKINILEAKLLALKRALKKLPKKADFVLIDGSHLLKKLDLPQKSIVKGDRHILSIAAASIIAKVTRDRLMIRLAKKFPQYGFEQHKGYGTTLHQERIKIYGLSVLHRLSFCKNFDKKESLG